MAPQILRHEDKVVNCHKQPRLLTLTAARAGVTLLSTAVAAAAQHLRALQMTKHMLHRREKMGRRRGRINPLTFLWQGVPRMLVPWEAHSRTTNMQHAGQGPAAEEPCTLAEQPKADSHHGI